MSVLKNNRQISNYEHINKMQIIMKRTAETIKRLSKRKIKVFGDPIFKLTNSAYDMMMRVVNRYYEYDINTLEKDQQYQYIIQELLKLQFPLFNLWNVEKFTQKGMGTWANMINEEITELERLMTIKPSKDKENRIITIDWNVVHNVEFLNNMSKLHRYIHSKVLHFSTSDLYSNGNLITHLADKAWYYVLKANCKIPTTYAMYEERKEYISKAMNCLREMEEPTLSLFNIQNYSDKIMTEWTEMLVNELNLLSGLKKSDAKRFKNLPK